MGTLASRARLAPSDSRIVRVYASAWQAVRLRHAIWPWIVLVLTLIGLLPMELVLPPGTAGTAIRRLMAFMLCSVVLGIWMVLVFNVLMQNQQPWARLLPGHVATLRGALYLGAAAVTVYAATLFAWAGWSWPIVALIVSPLCAAVACARRWPVVWIVLGAAGALLGWLKPSVLFGPLAFAWHAVPWALGATLLTGSALALRAVVFDGRASHAGAQTQLAATAAVMRGEQSTASQRTFNAGWLGPTRWGEWVYAVWLGRLLARPRSSLRARLALGIGPPGHWSGVFSNAIYMVVVMLAWVLIGLVPEWRIVYGSQGWLLLICVAMIGLLVPLQVPSALWATRREQALLVLLPGAPRAAALNRWLALRLATLDVMLVLMLMVIVVAFARLDPIDPEFARVDDAVLGALVVSLLLTLTLWRDWARAHAPAGRLQWGWIVGSVAVGGVAAVWVYGYQRPWYELAGWTALIALPLAGWSWRRLQRLPPAWPVGRIAEPR